MFHKVPNPFIDTNSAKHLRKCLTLTGLKLLVLLTLMGLKLMLRIKYMLKCFSETELFAELGAIQCVGI